MKRTGLTGWQGKGYGIPPFCFLCIVSMIMFQFNQVLGNKTAGEIHFRSGACHNHFTVSGSALGAARSGKGRWLVP